MGHHNYEKHSNHHLERGRVATVTAKVQPPINQTPFTDRIYWMKPRKLTVTYLNPQLVDCTSTADVIRFL